MKMMKNKVMIRALFPAINREYDIKVPINDIVWEVNKLIVKPVSDMNGISFDLKDDHFVMINKDSGKIYDSNEIIIETDIRNGTEILFIKEKNTTN